MKTVKMVSYYPNPFPEAKAAGAVFIRHWALEGAHMLDRSMRDMPSACVWIVPGVDVNDA